jgi:hypothetical protein
MIIFSLHSSGRNSINYAFERKRQMRANVVSKEGEAADMKTKLGNLTVHIV